MRGGVPLRGRGVVLGTTVRGVAPGSGPGARGIVGVAGHRALGSEMQTWAQTVKLSSREAR